jgi:predicted Zn-dependent peptidase
LQSARVQLMDSFASNSSMANLLTQYHATMGGWREILTDLQRVEDLTAADIHDVAARTFADDNCFTGYVLPAR